MLTPCECICIQRFLYEKEFDKLVYRLYTLYIYVVRCIMIYKHNEQVLKLILDNKHRKVGIYMGAGTASALLFYLLLHNYKRTTQFVLFVHHEDSKQQQRVENILKQLNFDTTIHYRVNNTGLPFNKFVQQCIDQGESVDVIYTGMHKQSNEYRHAIADKYGNVVNRYDDKESKRQKIKSIRTIAEDVPTNIKCVHPFADYDKAFIAAIYGQLKLRLLYRYTHSCDDNYEAPCDVGSCNKCMERKWAFEAWQ